ncbi:MAG: AAA family ATPase [Gammaproteobacteria bacterium]|nr:AAA family ATPase [Gammaproteobacteria bacterium]
MVDQTENQTISEQAVAEGGAYEVIRQRLIEQQKLLDKMVSEINHDRQQEFGSTEMKVLGRMRIRTENNCQAKDLVIVGGCVLFGYNVYIGLRKETRIEDVFSLFSLDENDGEYDLRAVEIKDSFLSDSRFKTDFEELYNYYKETTLSQLVLKDDKLLASFKIGQKLTDIRVFRWQVSPDGKQVDYIDNRGERDIQLPASHDFEWTECHRENVVDGRNPHINILDVLFVDASRGDITIKVENNTDVGLGIYSEPVEEENQSLDDAEFYFADLNQIILLKIKPYREESFRYLVFNRMSQDVQRFDAIGDACLRLPQDQGIIFPGGYYLTTGESKTFEDNLDNLVFKRARRSPNGEDVLYIFYQPETNVIALYAYNIIEKTLQNPLLGHGHGFYEDGRMIIFYADSEPNRVHPLQIWQTPYCTDSHASAQPATQSFYGKIGNSELVRGISELYSISRSMVLEDVSAQHYHQLSQFCSKIFDSYYWLNSPELVQMSNLLRQIENTAELVIDEYEKVESIRSQSTRALVEAEAGQLEIIRHIKPESWHSPQEFVDGLFQIRQHRGHLETIKSYRYIDIEKIQQLDNKIESIEQELNQQTIEFLGSENALDSYSKILDVVETERIKCETNAELKPHVEKLQSLAQGLDLISEMIASLKVDDATLQTRIVDSISEIYSRLNQQKAELDHQRNTMGGEEATAQFSAHLKLLNQSIHNALGMSTSPEKCDEQFSRLLVQLEELEGEFGDYGNFIADIIKKREEIFEAFEEHKQGLIDAQQRKAQLLSDAGDRILQSLQRRVKRITTQDELNTFFSADSLVKKVNEIVNKLEELDDSVKAEDIDSKLRSIREQAIRSLRDKSDLFEDDGQVIKLGPRHRFVVNNQELDLTILPKQDRLFVHLSGTDYFEVLDSTSLNEMSAYWSMQVPSESERVSRAEYLAYSILLAAENGSHKLSWEVLSNATALHQDMMSLVADYAVPRYREGYEKGVHDHDASLILQQLVPVYEAAGVLKFAPEARGFAAVYWANCQNGESQKSWPRRARNAAQMASVFSNSNAKKLLSTEIIEDLEGFAQQYQLPGNQQLLTSAAEYLVEELAQERVSFATTKYARRLSDDFITHLKTYDVWRDYQKALDDMKGQVGKRWAIAQSWLNAFVESQHKTQYQRFIAEAIGLLNAEQRIDRMERETDVQFKVEGLLSSHHRIDNRALTVQLHEFLDNGRVHQEQIMPAYEKFLELRHQAIVEKRSELRIEEFRAKPLSSFVRNRLINESYLPLIGDNLAKQIGTVGDKKRTDLMGLLLMISPPGYGKTTLMEYIADRLGLIFMKINCPVIGHSVTSVDPAQADNSASRQELEKLNLALEMGNNVMLYLDDIQHTSSEFLQKFISLCDGTRRIEGVWKNRTRTYDMRGKKFCVVMAGNPYTESGEAFQIPDMLANRADIYNLGDVLSGKEDIFALSYIENALTSNPVLAPLASRAMNDVYKFLDMADGVTVASTDFSHQYSAAEIREIVDVLQKLKKIQAVVWQVNQAYIAASAQDDRYRTEPVFKLQGSYRNMNKLAEKVSSIMSDDEMDRLIDDHYQGEAQLLTTGTEANLLKLAEIRGSMSEQQAQRWSQIKSDFMRNKAMGGDDADVGARIVVQLNDLVGGINSWRESVEQHRESTLSDEPTNNPLSDIAAAIQQLTTELAVTDQVDSKKPSDPSSEGKLADVLENTLLPLVRIMNGKLDLDLGTHQYMSDINKKLEMISQRSAPKASRQAAASQKTSKKHTRSN